MRKWSRYLVAAALMAALIPSVASAAETAAKAVCFYCGLPCCG